MSRRVNLPGAEEPFRPTQSPPATQPGAPVEKSRPDHLPANPERRGTNPVRKPSGRVKHDEKITVYVSREELLAVETARLALRAEHNLAVDRGRIVRAALAAAVSDLEQQGGESDLVRRLSQ